jgi:hypothetical protein
MEFLKRLPSVVVGFFLAIPGWFKSKPQAKTGAMTAAQERASRAPNSIDLHTVSPFHLVEIKTGNNTYRVAGPVKFGDFVFALECDGKFRPRVTRKSGDAGSWMIEMKNPFSFLLFDQAGNEIDKKTSPVVSFQVIDDRERARQMLLQAGLLGGGKVKVA